MHDRSESSNSLIKSFRRIDLNLFVLFDAIYSEGSITGAGNRLGLTQPAVSHALRRLRTALDDKLFLRKGKGVVPTPYARAIVDDVRGALDLLRSGLLRERQFDPATATASFRISMRAGLETRLLPHLAKRLDKTAPQVTVISTRIARRQLESELARGDVDLALDVASPVGFDICRQVLETEQLVVVGRKGNPSFSGGLTLKPYLAARHLIVSERGRGGTIEDYELSRHGVRRRIAMRCVNLSAGLLSVEQSDFLLTAGERQVEALPNFPNLEVHAFPLKAPPIEMMLYWHESRDKEPSNQWLRELVTESLGAT